MRNVKMTVANNILLIEVDLTVNLGPSKTGKSNLIASTEGNKAVPGLPNGKLGLNLYTTV